MNSYPFRKNNIIKIRVCLISYIWNGYPYANHMKVEYIACNLGLLCSEISNFTLVNVYVVCWYLRIVPVLHRPEVVDIGVKTIKKNMPYA